MKIYHISNCGLQAEMENNYTEITGLRKAAGCENLCRLTIENFSVKTEDEKLRELALMHINDLNPELENIAEDPDAIEAGRLSLMAELAVRVIRVSVRKKIYENAADFVIEQLYSPGNK